MSRSILTHHDGGLNDAIYVRALEGPEWTSAGGASTHYRIQDVAGVTHALAFAGKIPGQGITNECLLAIIVDRLESFQAGPFPCDENAAALNYLRGALMELKSRATRIRLEAGGPVYPAVLEPVAGEEG